MENKRDSGQLAGLALTAAIILICLFASVIIYQLGRKQLAFQKENAALKAEIAEWQLKSQPAITARDWWTKLGAVQNPGEITPDVLEHALNPCYTTPAGNWNLSDPSCGGYGERGKTIPIKIVHADR